MRSPFSSTPELTPEEELQAGELFDPVAGCELEPSAAASIRGRMLAALSSAVNPAAAGPRSRFAIASMAVIGPLMAVSAVGAATGDSPLEGPADLVETVAASIGIGGQSGEVRQDFEVRAEAAGDVGQPGSQPGNTANAPGLGGSTEDQAPDGDTLEGDEETAVDEETPEDASAAAAAAHENGKGCDDVLFAMGEPPFASPGGPVGCEVGNSAEHRQNGAKNEEAPEEEGGEEEGEEVQGESSGGVSHGLGLGHSEDRPGNGEALGHEKHEHEPNTHGNGPPAREEEPGDEELPVPTEPMTAATTPVPGDTTGAHGNSANAQGSGRNR